MSERSAGFRHSPVMGWIPTEGTEEGPGHCRVGSASRGSRQSWWLRPGKAGTTVAGTQGDRQAEGGGSQG